MKNGISRYAILIQTIIAGWALLFPFFLWVDWYCSGTLTAVDAFNALWRSLAGSAGIIGGLLGLYSIMLNIEDRLKMERQRLIQNPATELEGKEFHVDQPPHKGLLLKGENGRPWYLMNGKWHESSLYLVWDKPLKVRMA